MVLCAHSHSQVCCLSWEISSGVLVGAVRGPVHHPSLGSTPEIKVAEKAQVGPGRVKEPPRALA